LGRIIFVICTHAHKMHGDMTTNKFMFITWFRARGNGCF